MAHWGRFYEAHEVDIEWHVPSDDEISFVVQILDDVVAPLIVRLEELLKTTKTWGATERNDFCRYFFALLTT